MATVGPTNIPAYFNADSDFRTWGSTISAALASIGLVMTADTGMINWSSVSKPGGTSTSAGYEIWRFNDSNQGSYPVYLKVEYGSSAGAADRPAIWITVGTGSNGSGTLTGQLGARTQLGANASKSSGVQLPTYVSGSASELYLAFNIDTAATTFGGFIAVHRTKDGNANDTSDGIITAYQDSRSNSYFQYIPNTGTVPSQIAGGSAWPAIFPLFVLRSSAGSTADVCPLMIPLSGVWRYSKLVVCAAVDLPAGGSVTVSMLGGSHTLMALGCAANNTGNVVAQGNSTANAGIAFPWE